MNAWKHSGERTGTIELKHSENSITVIVRDHGKGFIFPYIEGLQTTGLKSLKHRAEELKGNLTIETSPDQGCKLTLTIPVDKNTVIR